VFESFFEGIQDHKIEARNWGMVFGLLAHITFRKCLKRKRAEMRDRRNPGKPVAPLDEIQAATANPGPSELVMMTELLDLALKGLDANERVVVDAYMTGLTTDAVAQQVGLSMRTVQRVIERFCRKLEELLRGD
jgi:DNA-directed RNA polymerase specialized sigma24 family protein